MQSSYVQKQKPWLESASTSIRGASSKCGLKLMLLARSTKSWRGRHFSHCPIRSSIIKPPEPERNGFEKLQKDARSSAAARAGKASGFLGLAWKLLQGADEKHGITTTIARDRRGAISVHCRLESADKGNAK
ncbi:hypothetical protein [Variovorax sp. dw_954]|uniref:hypothetical protein n=1 Tax=Variovorax sp. dw_954 TaxID=2720078 RepID=UPI001BD438FF|nr:hypothetical protein [Variovorax sp. dw_954]